MGSTTCPVPARPKAARGLLPALALSLACAAAEAPAVRAPYNSDPTELSPLPAAEAARRWRWPEGFRVEVFAAEPEVHQPIAMAVDDRGRLWVAECHTYAEHRTGFATDLRDRVVVFEDSDGDGRHDRRTVFLEGLERLTSVEVGFGGVWLLASPRLLFVPDRDGDARPDGPAEVRLDGFEWRSNHHTIANGLRWGPDGWLYGRHGIQGHSRIGRPGSGDADRIRMNVGIWRHHPVRGEVEVVAEGTTNPWGMDWNEVGEAFFINTVIGHVWHVIPGAHYRRMYGDDYNPNLYRLIDSHADHVHWAAGEKWNDWQRLGTTAATSAAGGGHAHTGLMFYAGDNWPDDWRGKLLTINFNGRRLNVESVEPAGSGYVARHRPDVGFAADPFFRGIDLVYGPDGGVYIADWSDTGECHDHDGVHRLSGRIYKVTHGHPARPSVSDVGAVADADLPGLLDAHNEFFVRHARRRIQERAASGHLPAGVRGALHDRFRAASGTVVRLRALWALHAAGGTDPDFLRGLLGDGDPCVRTWAVRLLLDDPAAAARDGRNFTALAELARREAAAPVRLALASGLQRLPAGQRVAVASPLAARADDAADPNLPAMLWYGIEPLGDADPMALAHLAVGTTIPFIREASARRLSTAPGGSEALGMVLSRTLATPALGEVLRGMLEGLRGRRRAGPPAGWAAVAPVLARHEDPAVRDAFRLLGNRFGDPLALEATRRVVLDPAAAAGDRRDGLQSLVEARIPDLRATCEAVLGVPGLTVTAAGGLALSADPDVAGLLLARYPDAAPGERAALVDILTSRREWAGDLLGAIGEGKVPRGDLGAFHARRIRGLGDPALDARLGVVWGSVAEPGAEAAARIAEWRRELTPEVLRSADRGAGRRVYQARCAPCHVLNGEGAAVGPELTGAARDNLDYLLLNILDPSGVVPAEYRLWTVTLKDGRVLTGFLREVGPSGFTLRTPSASWQVATDEVESREATPESMMPSGLLDGLETSEVRDLFGYLMDR